MDDWIENARLIVDSVAAIVPADGGLERVRRQRFERPGYSREVFAEMGGMGWLQMRLPESQGGAGLGMRECCAMMVALGRGLVPEPAISALLANRLIAGRADDDVLCGATVVVAAWQDRTDSLAFADTGAETALCSGVKRHVAGAAGADVFAVLGSQGVALVPAGSPGLRLDVTALQDGGFEGTLTLDRVAVEWLPVEDPAAALDEAVLAQSAYLLGLSERGIEMTIDYLKIRKQFGQPIGSFQALQHRLTELKIQLELSRAAIFATAGRIDAGVAPATRPAAVSRTKARAANLALAMAREAVQMHGAIGTTDEADIGLVVSKAISEANRFGSARLHRVRHVETSEGTAA